MSTPVRRQYLHLKHEHPDAILFFRMGDFYEAFDEDAHTIARELNLVLTTRDKTSKTPMAGVPHHAAESYIARLVKAGYKVAICEQVSKTPVNGLMPREIVRIVTPGTVVEPSLLDAKEHNYLACLHQPQPNRAGLAYVDITTGEFYATVLEGDNVTRLIADELARLNPAELIIAESLPPVAHAGCPLTRLEDWRFEPEKATQTLQAQFSVRTLDGFGLGGKTPAIQAAGAILQYLVQTQKGAVSQITGLRYYSTSQFMVLDSHTRRNLELMQTLRGETGKGSLVDVLDATITPMGGRLLRAWLRQPLLDVSALNRRLDAVEAFFNSTAMRADIRDRLKGIADMERLTSRILQGIAHPRNLIDLRTSLESIPALIDTLRHNGNPQFSALADGLDPCPDVLKLLSQAIVDDPPAQLSKGGVINPAFSDELSALLNGSKDARRWIAELETRERERSGIPKLKVGFNKIFGYYIEISKSNLAMVPPEYIRKQTLVNAERFITPELKEYESLVLNAEERQLEIEARIFQEVVSQVAAYHKSLYQTADTLARLDVFSALADAAVRNNYVRPVLTDGDALDIVDGRHPVVEKTVQEFGTGFVPNDTFLSADDLIWIITGPNMSGKSTLLRQVALIVLMAQIGSFVPAASATIGVVDRIFTRIGAQDEIHAGQSTFMVEMVETAALLSQSTSRSLLILDEIGRGTSTYDGLAIARAIVEYIHNSPRLRAKTLFATHYHELVELENYLPHVRNHNVAVADNGGDVVFLHKIVPGGADRSYGVHVAQLAGIPKPVITRAGEILSELETDSARVAEQAHIRDSFGGVQLSFLAPETHPVVDALKSLKVEEMSPLEALNKLYELQQIVQKS